MRTTTVIQTRRGVCASIARRWQLLNVNLTLAWAEHDHKLYAQQYRGSANLPFVVARLERDIADLRMQQTILRQA